jgi:protein SCO1
VRGKQMSQGLTVVNFFFAGCSQVCPASIAFLREIQKDLASDLASRHAASTLQFWAISIDPMSDTPQTLNSYAQRMQLTDWQLLTGEPEQVERLATQSFFAKSRLEVHTERAYLIDSQRRIRGIYNATQRGDLLRLREDVLRLASTS